MKKAIFIAPGAIVLGDVTLGDKVGIWYHATVRGDRAPIIIGQGSNVQDNAVVHVDDDFGVVIGENVTIGHGAIIHGCEIGDNTLIGMGAIVMNGAKIGQNCIVGAGALVTQNTIVPDNSLILGNPAKVKRAVTQEEVKSSLRNAALYVEEALQSLEAMQGK
ncbi:MAG: gamma carbonic anhydrase family protein [Lachnospiraceae bacterium]|nr:gamma carbonic anhydrase family protein [Lachnospiraceae bacterium]